MPPRRRAPPSPLRAAPTPSSPRRGATRGHRLLLADGAGLIGARPARGASRQQTADAGGTIDRSIADLRRRRRCPPDGGDPRRRRWRPAQGPPRAAKERANAGVRAVGLVHYVDNGLGTVQLPWNEWVLMPLPVRRRQPAGLSAAGAEAADALVDAGILVDLAHADATRKPPSPCASGSAPPAARSSAPTPALRRRARLRPVPHRRRAAGHRRHRRPHRLVAALLPRPGCHRRRRLVPPRAT